ncbi:glycoside hydrolase family 9 protein [Cellulomonas sp. zg-ZUI188]|uniref:Endoglucanase n=1 Tax=Cellulomonas fengjieae TaxID=2819978 RepID=A0ABS3SFX7_9CELL|nr:glycoside hydrolase family 9 protein [Cellulomonas fengjieae]QVI67835.1 glycoside hydrolase family 9 protein [Cellulomonas fengjieae]
MVVSRTMRRTGAALATALALAVAGVAPAIADVPVESFEDGPGAWVAYGHAGEIDTSDGRLCVDVPAGSAQYGVGVVLNGVAVEEGSTYTLAFSASASTDVTVRALVGQNGAPYGTVLDTSPALTSETTEYSYEFTASATYPATAAPDDPEGQIAFQLGGFSPDAWTFCMDDVSLSSDVELLPHTSFAESLGPWGLYGGSDPVFAGGSVCTSLPGGQSNPWDAGLAFTGLPIEEGQNYVLTFTASATPSTPVRVIVGEGGGAYRTTFEQSSVPLTDELTTYTYPFTANLTFPADGAAPGQVAFHLGKSTAYDFCISDVSLRTTASPPPPYEPETGPRVRVNQVGYVPDGPKRATLVTDATEAVPWELHDAADAVVATGSSAPAGTDASTALGVHVIDFSDVTTPGTGYTLVADGETSHPFDIDADLYQQLRQDSLDYFYLARSGTPIDGAIVGEEYAREPGHVGVAPNQGDTAVPCIGPRDYYDGWTCDYTLDVSGGWYDAGDHGKYVVNGGISVAQLLGTYERTLTAPSATDGALGDNTLDLPEHGNDVPDVLDEARWELEWMQKMIAPSGQYAGMVHHKIHDEGWTGLPLLPADDPQVRSLARPSTAATLNVAAVAAQGARLFREYDPAFADSLLATARSTWAAALEHPDVYAPAAAGADGGGAYDDSNVADEFYWAAAELFLTTGEDAFEQYVLASPQHTADVFTPDGFSWGSVAALGRLDLATVPNDLPGLDEVKASVVAGADEYVASQAEHAFGSVYSPTGGQYAWGSNSAVANNLVVIGVAYDLTGDPVYSRSVLEGMDYLLGRNGLNQSYVTGWGEVASHRQHSRWFANSLDPGLPEPPRGSLAGGPNSQSGTWDPTMQAAFTQGCAPAMCYLDNIQSWASNEITINWNSALSWVASFVADQGSGAPAQVAPTITQQPASVTAALGSTVSFTAAATGTPEPTVQWQIQQAGPWVDVVGATSTTLEVVVRAGAQYRAVFTNEAGSATTETAQLTVAQSAPVVTKHPAPVRAKLGTSVTFSAAATGYPAPTVRWQVRWFGSPWVTVPGATSSTLTFRATLLGIGTEYRAVYTNAAGSTATNPARLTLGLRGGHWITS